MALPSNQIVKKDTPLNDRPIIAILAQLTPPDKNNSYIAASYIKYLEGSGARVVPIPASMSLEEAEKIFESVNGVLFPGGGIAWYTSGYYHHAKLFFDKAVEANKKGDYFPIWGTCLGFQTLHVVATGNDSIITPNESEDVAMPLNFTDKARSSRLFRGMSDELYKSLATEDITYNHHRFGLRPETYETTELHSMFDILSTNVGTNGNTFISSVEGK